MTSASEPFAEPARHLLAFQQTMQEMVSHRAVIEQAKGALMATYGLTADAAFDLLRFHSQSGNVKLRAIAAELTSLLSTGPTDSRAVGRFDRLIDEVTRGLQPHPEPVAEGVDPFPPVDMASLWSQIAADRRDDDAGSVAHLSPPGITIAGNAPGLPLVYANEAFAELTGYPVGDVLGRNCRFLQGPATDPHDIATLSRALHIGRDVSVVVQNYRRDGSAFLNEVSISPIRNPTDQITHYVGTQTDVTHRGALTLPRRRNPSGSRPSPPRRARSEEA